MGSFVLLDSWDGYWSFISFNCSKVNGIGNSPSETGLESVKWGEI